jgi:hypothetical protein
MSPESLRELAQELAREARDFDLKGEIEKRLQELDLRGELEKRLPDIELPRLRREKESPSSVLVLGVAAGLLIGLAGAAAMIRWQRMLKDQGWTLMPSPTEGSHSVLREPVAYLRTVLGSPEGDGYRPTVDEGERDLVRSEVAPSGI